MFTYLYLFIFLVMKQLISSFIFSRLGYCKALPIGLSFST